MVDAESVFAKLGRLDTLLRLLDQARERGRAAVVSDVHAQLEVERALQLSIQICIDVGAHLVSELGLEPPADYQGIFASLDRAGAIDGELAERLAAAARLRNLLVHDYGAIDHGRLWDSLGDLDDLRAFAAASERLAREGPPG